MSSRRNSTRSDSSRGSRRSSSRSSPEHDGKLTDESFRSEQSSAGGGRAVFFDLGANESTSAPLLSPPHTPAQARADHRRDENPEQIFAPPPGVVAGSVAVLQPASAGSFDADKVIAYAKMIGIDMLRSSEFGWIADEMARSELPIGWAEVAGDRGELRFLDTTTGIISVDHPMAGYYRNLYRRNNPDAAEQAANPTDVRSLVQGADGGETSSSSGDSDDEDGRARRARRQRQRRRQKRGSTDSDQVVDSETSSDDGNASVFSHVCFFAFR